MICSKCGGTNIVSIWPRRPKKHKKLILVLEWILIIITLGLCYIIPKVLNIHGSRRTICLGCGYESDNWKRTH